MKKALLMVNMGGPSSTDKIEGYLKAIFNDPAILSLPTFMRKPLASFIASRRAPKVAERYNKIGGASPLPHWTKRLRDKVDESVKESGKQMEVAYAFRYSDPTVDEMLSFLAKSGVEEVILLPLFPHHTKAMTGSIEKEAERVNKQFGLKLQSVPAWADADEIISIWYKYLEESISSIDEKAHVIFVAHGIPLRNVRKGDDYPYRVADTAKKLGGMLPDRIAWSLAFQSRVGPVKWTQPYLDDEIDRVALSKIPIILMPLSFVADCLETLYDLDIIAKERTLNLGVEKVSRARVFNDDPKFAKVLAKIAVESNSGG